MNTDRLLDDRCAHVEAAGFEVSLHNTGIHLRVPPDLLPAVVAHFTHTLGTPRTAEPQLTVWGVRCSARALYLSASEPLVPDRDDAPDPYEADPPEFEPDRRDAEYDPDKPPSEVLCDE